MKKRTRRGLSAFLAIVMILTSLVVPISASAASTTKVNELIAAAASFEAKMKDGKVYNNVAGAYKAYVNVNKYLDAIKYGGSQVSYTDTQLQAPLNALDNAMLKMTEFVPKTATTQGNRAFPNDDTYTDASYYDQMYKNTLYANPVAVSARTQVGTLVIRNYLTQHQEVYPMFYHNTQVLMLDNSGVAPTVPIMYASRMWARDRSGLSFRIYHAGFKNGDGLTLDQKWNQNDSNNDERWNFTYCNFKGENRTIPTTIGQTADYYSYGPTGYVVNASWSEYSTNIAKFTGTLGSEEYSKKLSPEYSVHITGGNGIGDLDNTFTAADTTADIYVVNYKALLDTLKTAKTANGANIAKYKEGGLADFCAAMDAATKFDPNSYDYSNPSVGVTNCAGGIKTNADNLKVAPTEDAYALIRTIMDKAMPVYDSGNGNANNIYTKASWDNFAQKYSACEALMANVVTSDYSASGEAAALAAQLASAQGQLKNQYAYKYVNAAGTQVGNVQYVTAVKDLVAPNNTADKLSHDKSKTPHSAVTTSYFWNEAPAIVAGTYEYTVTEGYNESALDCGTETINAKTATCTSTGYTGDEICSECKEVIIAGTEIPMQEHVMKLYSARQDSTCLATGKEAVYKCENCSHTTGGETIPVKEHTVVEIPAVAPTCEKDGSTAGEKCSECNTILITPTVLPKLNHNFTGAIVSSNNNGTHNVACVNDGCADTKEVNCTYTSEVITPPTTKPGLERYTCECGYSYDKVLDPIACDHATTETRNGKTATCTEDGYTGDTYCTKCDEKIADGQVITKLGHNLTADPSAPAVASTCKTAGHEAGKKCTRCDYTEAGKTLALNPANHENLVAIPAVAATCTAAGNEEGQKCEACGVVTVEAKTIDALGHNLAADPSAPAVASTCKTAGHEAGKMCTRCDYTEVGAVLPLDENNHEALVEIEAIPATCTQTGMTAGEECSACGTVTLEQTVVDALGHDWSAWTVTKEATVKEDGSRTRTCKRDASHTETEVIPALGVKITVKAENLGTVTLNGEDVTAGAVVRVPYDSEVTLTVTPNDGAELFGWEVNGVKIISNELTYTTRALADIVYDPIVTVPDVRENFTVVFYDMFGNVLSSQTVKSGADVIVPKAPIFTGYTFDSWSMTNDEIEALTADTTITANYSKVEENLYTVTANGCTIVSNGTEVTDVLTGVAYDTLVTVKCPGTSSWTINGATVAFGEEYSFYVGSNVEVKPVMGAAVTATPVVAGVSVDRVKDSYKVVFLATRSIDGGEFVNAGFIYGKNLADDELVLENIGKNGAAADAGAIKAYYCATPSKQFSLSYGIKAEQGVAKARAFLAYIDDNGDTQVVYADVQEYVYSTSGGIENGDGGLD